MKIPSIKNALKNISSTCQKQLSCLYPAGIPAPVQQRYEQELSFLSQSDYIDDFEIFRCMSNEAEKSSSIISTRGTVSGSLIYFLIGKNCFNPLPVHYYCPECGYFEFIQTHLFEIDLPEKKCPHCSTNISAHGYNLSLESVWGISGEKILSFEYNLNVDFFPFAHRVLVSLYPENQIVPIGLYRLTTSSYSETPYKPPLGISQFGFAILPTGSTLNDFSDLSSYLDNGEPCITGTTPEIRKHLIKPILMNNTNILNSLIKLQRATGLYVNEICNTELHEITWRDIYNTTVLSHSCQQLFYYFKPKTYKNMVELKASAHNSFSWKNTDDSIFDIYSFEKMMSTDSFKKYPCFTREDFFDYLLENGTDRALAYKLSEFIRCGKATHPITAEQQQQLGLPDDAAVVAKNYRYLFPKAHCIETLLALARLAFYSKTNKRLFNRILFKNDASNPIS